MGSRILGLGSLMAAGMLTTACLSKETNATVYLEADGSATWTVLEQQVRSDEAKEEADYIAAVSAEQNAVARGLQVLRPARIHTEILRATRPYAVYTEATFGSFDDLMGALAWGIGIETGSKVEATSTVERRGLSVTWTLTIHVADDDQVATDSDQGSPLFDLLAGLNDGRFVLAKGRFTSAIGFEISSDGHIATLREPDEADGDSAPTEIVVSLTWTDESRY